ncbi:glycosyltransferase [Paenibacillus sp. ALJ109b]|uniref:glycosyltransferase n=1 Tax=Paenibacillus sp. ALJ109b TaxID=2709068 RepID=UPI0013D82E47|nr:glycosyltransferase [Paenibacillus sp. ALJ109b]NEU60021.1 glycosyltransferase family 4 protein [Paenibacillus sp. ALJ109b]
MKKPTLRLLMIIDKLEVGGTETYVSAVVEEMGKRGVSIYVAGNRGSLLSKFRALGCPIFTKINDRQRLEQWIIKHKINVINAHHESTGIIGSALSRKLRIPFVYTIHGTYYPRALITKIMKRCYSRHAVISVSWPVKKWLEEKNIQSVLIPNGINTQHFRYNRNQQLLTQLNIASKSKVLLYVSRIEDEKAEICKSFLRAAQRCMDSSPNMHVVVVGGGPGLNSVKKLAARKHSNRIHVMGERLDTSAFFSISDVVVGTGRVALEAMSCKRPVIAIGAKGIFGIVKPDNFKLAWRYYFGDHRAKETLEISKIENLIRTALRSKKSSKNWGEAGREFVKKQFNISGIVDKLLSLYQSFI